MSAVTRYQHRGLRIVHQHRPGELTAIALAVRAGARFDGRHPGLAHLTEHMLFQGTPTMDQIALNRRAAELGGEHNADTGYEDVSLTFEVFNEDFEEALALLADQFYHTEVPAARLGKERRVVLEEIRGRLDDPAERLYRHAWTRLFSGSIAHPVTGTLKSVRAIDAGAVRRFLRRHFDHANTVVAVVGGVSATAVRESVRRHFRFGHEGPTRPVPRVRLRPGGRVRLSDDECSQAYLTMLLCVPPRHRTLLATGVALDLVGSDPDSRLFQELRERLGLSYEVTAHLEWGPDWALAVVSASAARSQAERLLRAVTDTCRRAAEEGFTADELERARKKLRYRYAVLADSRLDLALALAESALWNFPMPREAESIIATLSAAEIETAWRDAVAARRVTAVLA